MEPVRSAGCLLLVIAPACLFDATGGVGSGGAGAASGGSSTGGGGPVSCSTDEACGVTDACGTHACVDGACVASFADIGTSCGMSDDRRCDGEGTCLTAPGGSCDAASECLGGFCVDDVCCDSACSDDCQACDSGTCTPVEVGKDPQDECPDGICDGASGCAIGTPVSIFRFGSEAGFAEARALAVDGKNEVTFGGAFSDSLTIGKTPLIATGSRDGYVARIASNGEPRWGTTIGGSGLEDVTGVALSPSGDVYVTGFFDGALTLESRHQAQGSRDVFVAKLRGATGAPEWSVTYGDEQEQWADGIAVDADGNVLVVGSFFGEITIGEQTLTSAGSADTFVAKLDGQGAPIWAKKFGGEADDRSRAIAARSDGSMVIAGITKGTITFGGTTLAEDDAEAAWVAALDASGEPIFADILKGDADQSVWSVAVGPDDRLAICGDLNGETTFDEGALTPTNGRDVFIAVWDAKGDPLWASLYGGNGDQSARGLAFDPSGNVLLSGEFRSDVDFGGDMLASTSNSLDLFVAKLTGSGQHLWSARYGDGSEQWSAVVKSGSAGDVWTAGAFYGAIAFEGGETETSEGDRDAFIIRLSP